MHFSTDPIIVLASYLRLFQDECDNLIKIAEGITYKLPQDEIMADLILL
jgi:vacuolar-type H+-ATPase subunit C/Vma6